MSVQTIVDRLGKNAIPVQIPIGKEDDFVGLIDLFEMEAYYYKDDKGEWHSTSGMKPQPFMRPALNENREQIKRILKEAILND